MSEISSKRKTAVLLGIAGSNNSFCLSLYNLKAYACTDPEIRHTWEIAVLQHPFINVTRIAHQLSKLADQTVEYKPDLVGFSCYMWNVNVLVQLAELLRARLPMCIVPLLLKWTIDWKILRLD